MTDLFRKSNFVPIGGYILDTVNFDVTLNTRFALGTDTGISRLYRKNSLQRYNRLISKVQDRSIDASVFGLALLVGASFNNPTIACCLPQLSSRRVFAAGASCSESRGRFDEAAIPLKKWIAAIKVLR